MKATYDTNHVEVRPNSTGRVRNPYRVYKGGKFVQSYRTSAEAEKAAGMLRSECVCGTTADDGHCSATDGSYHREAVR